MIALKKYIQDHDRLYKLCKLGENQNEFFIYCTFYDLRMFTFSKKLNFLKIYIYIYINFIYRNFLSKARKRYQLVYLTLAFVSDVLQVCLC